MDVETRVVIDANASNAIREIGKLDDAAGDADKALEQLDGATVDVDTSSAVDNLRDVEFTGDDVRAALDKLDAEKVTITVDDSDVVDAGGAVDAVDAKTSQPFKVDFDVDTDKLDTVKRKLDDVDTSGRAGGVAIGGIGGSISELPGVGALGPIAESLGQLTENALEGGESIKGIGTAIGVLGGTAAVMYGIQKAMQSIADTDAFDEEQVSAFREALEETNTAAEAVLKTIEDAGGVKGRAGGIGPLFEGTKDITAALVDAKVAAEDFVTAVTPGPEAAAANQEITDKLRAQRDALKEQALALEASGEFSPELRNRIEALGDAIEITNETLKNNTKATDDNVVSAEFLATATDAVAEAARASEDANRRYEAGLRDAEQATDRLREANEKLRGDLDKREAYLNLIDQFDDMKAKGKEAWDATAAGAVDAEQKQRDYEQSVIDTKQQVIDYTETVGDVPLDVTTDLVAQVDTGQLDSLTTTLDDLTAGPHKVYVDVYGNIDPKLLNTPYLPYIRPPARLTGVRD